ncbi:MAG: hypothetical protein WC337_11245, partial [Candidatus Muiribacteriota bacterium]
MKKLVSLFIVLIFFISVSSMNIQQRAENIMFLNNQIEETLLSIEVLKNHAEFIRLFNISSKQAQTDEELEFSYKIHEIIQETKEEVENSLSFLSKIIEKRNHSSNRSFNIIKILNDVCDSYPEITMLFIEYKDELIINSYNRVYLTRVLNSIRFDETDYEERFLNISLSKYMADFIKNRWEFAYEEFKKSKDKEKFRIRKENIIKILNWYDRIPTFFSVSIDKTFKKGLNEYGRKNYRQALNYFNQALNISNGEFIKKGGNNWTGLSYEGINSFNTSIEKLTDSAIKEEIIHRKNSIFNIIYLYRAKLEQNTFNLQNSIKTFTQIRDKSPNDDEQIAAELEIINSYIELGNNAGDIYEKEGYYKTVLNLCDDFYNKWIITEKVRANEIVETKIEVFKSLIFIFLENGIIENVINYLNEAEIYVNKIMKEFNFFDTSPFDYNDGKCFFLNQITESVNQLLVNSLINLNSNKEFELIIKRAGEILNNYFEIYKKEIPYTDYSDWHLYIGIAFINDGINYIHDMYRYYLKDEINSNFFGSVYKKQLEDLIVLFSDYEDVYWIKIKLGMYLIKNGKLEQAKKELNEIMTNSPFKEDRIMANSYLVKVFFIQNDINQALIEGEKYYNKYKKSSDFVIEGFIYYIRALNKKAFETGDYDLLLKSEKLVEEIKPSYWDYEINKDEFINTQKKFLKGQIKLMLDKTDEAEKEFKEILNKENNYLKAEALKELAFIEKSKGNFQEALINIKKAMKFYNEIYYYQYYDEGSFYIEMMPAEYMTSDNGVIEAKEFLINDLLKITVTPLIENLNPGESVILTAKITYPDGTDINTSGLEEMTWSWSGTGKKTTRGRVEYYQHGNTKYTLKPVNNSNQIEFTLLGGNYMEPIITAKVTFDVKETRGLNRIVSRTVELTGQNKVPIMIVDRNGERVKRIPMVDSSNLDGYDMGKDPFSG